MGCTNSNTIEQRIRMIRMVQCRHRGIGMLRVRVQHVKQLKRVSDFNQCNRGYLQIHFMNQQFTTALSYDQINKSTLYPNQTEFHFVVNVLNTQKYLQLNLFGQQSKGNKVLFKIASMKEIVDDQFFTQGKLNQENKKSCNICLEKENNGQKVGWVRMELEFTPMKYDILTIRVNSVTLRIQPPFRQRRIYINIKIGGQQFQSQSFLQNQHFLPKWQNAIACFIIPEYLPYGRLSVYEKDEMKGIDYLIGELKFNLKVILESDELQTFTETVTLKDKVTGSVNLQFLKTKDQIPVVNRIQKPKRITYQEEKKLQLLEKNHNGCYGANYVSKKSSQATLCSSTKSNDIISSNRFNKKLLELKQNCLQMRRENDREEVEKNQFYNDQQNNQKQMFRGKAKQCMVQNIGIERIFSDPQFNLQQMHIQSTSSIIISPHSSSPSNEQYSSFNLSCCSKINKRSTQNNIINLKEIDNLSKKNIQIKIEPIVRFDSIPDDMSSKSFGAVESEEGLERKDASGQRERGCFRQRSGQEEVAWGNQKERQKQFIAGESLKHKSLIIGSQEQSRLSKKHHPVEQKCVIHSFQKYQKPAETYDRFQEQGCINYSDFDIKIGTIISKKIIPTSS